MDRKDFRIHPHPGPDPGPGAPNEPSAQDGCTGDLGVRADAELEAAGWVRRHLVGPDRAPESIELYESMGFEVRSRTLTEADFVDECSDCASIICRTYVQIYTRKPGA